MIMLCILIYTGTPCGLRTVVKILSFFEQVLGESFGKVPCYNTVRGWVLKLGLSVYEEEKPKGVDYVAVMDESIMVNKEKLLLTLGIKAEHQGRPVSHKDVTVLDMKVGASFKREDVNDAIERVTEACGQAPEYGVSDGAHNLVGGFKDAGVAHHLDISHTLGNCMKHVYGKDAQFVALTTKLGKIRLQYHLSDKAWLLPPNMRAIARFMNLAEWVNWATDIIGSYDTLEDKMQQAYAFILDYREFIAELGVCIDAIRHVETICKTQGFCARTNALCQDYIISHVIGNANNRCARVGLEMLDYFRKQAELLPGKKTVHHISSDIIESDFGIFKSKKSPNKLYGMTSMVLMLPLYPTLVDYSVAENQNFKVRLANVKLKDVDLWAKENLTPNMVKLRSQTLKKRA